MDSTVDSGAPAGGPGRGHAGREAADSAVVHLLLLTPVRPCCVRGVLVRFVVGVCVIEPLPAARARAVCARVVSLRAGCVVRLHSVCLHRAAFARQRRRHHGDALARASCWRCACLVCSCGLSSGPRCAFVLVVWCACAALAYIVRCLSTPHPWPTPAT